MFLSSAANHCLGVSSEFPGADQQHIATSPLKPLGPATAYKAGCRFFLSHFRDALWTVQTPVVKNALNILSTLEPKAKPQELRKSPVKKDFPQVLTSSKAISRCCLEPIHEGGRWASIYQLNRLMCWVCILWDSTATHYSTPHFSFSRGWFFLSLFGSGVGEVFDPLLQCNCKVPETHESLTSFAKYPRKKVFNSFSKLSTAPKIPYSSEMSRLWFKSKPPRKLRAHWQNESWTSGPLD